MKRLLYISMPLVILLSLCSCKQTDTSLIGQWRIASYVLEGVEVDADRIIEYCDEQYSSEYYPAHIGERLADNYGESRFVFFDDGTVSVKWSDFDGGYRDGVGVYTIAGSTVKVTLNDSPVLLSMEGGKLFLEIQDEMRLCYKKDK